jgi:putative flippase GtrA
MATAPLTMHRLAEVVRYYQAGIVNAAFGFGLFSALVYLGLNIFGAQICSHIMGAAFNYLTYSRHVFRDAGPSRLRFALSYIGNYFASLATLWAVSRIIISPYIAGFAALVIVSVGNYFALKYLVFRKPGVK